MTTGQRIKSKRKALGTSAEELVEIIGISPATIYRYEKGDIKKIPANRIIAIADALKTTFPSLMGQNNKKAKEAT